MMFDVCNSPVSLSTQGALDDWNAMIRAFLAHGTATPEHLGAVLRCNPDFAMGHAARGLFSLMMGRAELVQTAREAAASAHQARAGGSLSKREVRWIDALDHWLAGHPSVAIAAMEEILKDAPQDTLSAKVSHAIRFILGDAAGMRRSIEPRLGRQPVIRPETFRTAL